MDVGTSTMRQISGSVALSSMRSVAISVKLSTAREEVMLPAIARLYPCTSSREADRRGDECNVDLARQITDAGVEARKVEQAELRSASETLSGTAREFRTWVESARLASVQNLRLVQMGVAAFLGGILLWSMLPGVIARAVPESWGWPERIAARALRMDLWHAGERMMAQAYPERWKRIVAQVDSPAYAAEVLKREAHR